MDSPVTVGVQRFPHGLKVAVSLADSDTSGVAIVPIATAWVGAGKTLDPYPSMTLTLTESHDSWARISRNCPRLK